MGTELQIPQGVFNQSGGGAVEIAAAYRKSENSRDGYVVVFGCELSGWTLTLDRPQSWRPGCIAVDVDGNQWETIGGDAYNGAKVWKPIECA